MNAPAELKLDAELVPTGVIVPSSTHIQQSRRKRFSDEAILELAQSIKTSGVINPILVRPYHAPPNDAKGAFAKYEIVAGERRWLATQRAGVAHIPAVIRELDDGQVLEAQLVENLQRTDLNPLEEAEGYAELKTLKGYDAEKIGELIGKSKSYVYARLKLNELCATAREALAKGEIDFSKALLVARFAPKLQPKAHKAIAGHWISARDAFNTLRRQFMTELSRAPFSLDDERTGAQVGPKKFSWHPRTSCAACPNNSRNDSDLGLDASAHVCTDKQCFEIKVEAHWAERLAEAQQQGRHILSGDDAKGAVPHIYQSYNDRFVRLDAECQEADGGEVIDDESEPAPLPTFRALLADTKLQPVLAQTAEGLVELVPTDVAAKALKAKGITLHVVKDSTSAGSADESEADRAKRLAEHKKEDERVAVEVEYRKRLFAQIHAKFKGPLKRPDLERIVDEFSDMGLNDAMDDIYPDAPAAAKLSETDLLRYIVCFLIADDVETYHARNSDKPGKLLEVAQRLNIDAKKIRADVVRDLKPVSVPQEETAGVAEKSEPAAATGKSPKKTTTKKAAAKKAPAKKAAKK